MSKSNPFKWRHYEANIILHCMRWQKQLPAQLPSGSRNGEWAGDGCASLRRFFALVQKYGPELDKRCRPHLLPTNDSWRVDQTYIKAECRRGTQPHCPFLFVKGQDKYLYRAVDSEGNTLDFRITALAWCTIRHSLFPQSVERGSHSRT